MNDLRDEFMCMNVSKSLSVYVCTRLQPCCRMLELSPFESTVDLHSSTACPTCDSIRQAAQGEEL